MTSHFLNEAKKELINGYSKKRHPFRYFSLATIKDSQPEIRTIVLRKLIDDFNIIFYTDYRSEKTKHIKNNSNVSALFYHPKKLLQIKITGNAVLEKDLSKIERSWKNINDNSKKDYTTILAPGSPIKNPDLVDYSINNNFCIVKIIPKKIEILQLKRPNHIRISYFKGKDNEWIGQFLTP